MAIKVFSRYMPFYRGGLEIYNQILFEGLKNRGYNIELIKVEKLPRIFKLVFFYIKRIMLIVLKGRSDNIVIVHYGSFLDVLSLVVLNKYFKKVICIAHIGPMWFHIRQKYFKKITINIVNKYCHSLYLISKKQEEIYYDHKNIIRINAIIDPKYFEIKKNDKFLEFSDYFLYFGRLSEDKGIHNLIEAFSKVYKNSKYMLLLLGEFKSKKYKDKINNQIIIHGLAEQVKFLGYISNISKKIQYIDNSISVIYPSFYDANPLVVVETFARGKKCLCSNISETKNIVSIKELLFNPNNNVELEEKIKQLPNIELKESDLKHLVKDFTIKSVIDKMIKHDGI
jgi:glycosyltransferase involved in cell wall biosynthesis